MCVAYYRCTHIRVCVCERASVNSPLSPPSTMGEYIVPSVTTTTSTVSMTLEERQEPCRHPTITLDTDTNQNRPSPPLPLPESFSTLSTVTTTGTLLADAIFLMHHHSTTNNNIATTTTTSFVLACDKAASSSSTSTLLPSADPTSPPPAATTKTMDAATVARQQRRRKVQLLRQRNKKPRVPPSTVPEPPIQKSIQSEHSKDTSLLSLSLHTTLSGMDSTSHTDISTTSTTAAASTITPPLVRRYLQMALTICSYILCFLKNFYSLVLVRRTVAANDAVIDRPSLQF